MSAIDSLENIVNNKHLTEFPFKYCLANKFKIPYTVKGSLARPNESGDFVSLDELINCESLDKYEAIGISIQASKICALDIDKCFSKPFDISTGDDRAKDIIQMFKNIAYIEFSFSGKGLRILFIGNDIANYSDIYYIKNTKTGCEYYQPSNPARYVTLTGRTIYDNSLYLMKDMTVLYQFLNKYMLKPVKTERKIVNKNDEKSLEKLMKMVRKHYSLNHTFQELWFNKEHYLVNNLSQESDTDFKLLSYLYSHITQDELLLRLVFEESPYFKTKDQKHMKKWTASDYRYYKFMYQHL